MNKHKNILYPKPFPPVGCTTIVEQPFDHMPVEVATEMLCAPKARMTNRERKECFRARERHFVSTRTARPVDERRHRFILGRNYAQLVKLERRGLARCSELTHNFQTLSKQLDKVRRATAEEMPQPLADALSGMIKRKQAELDIALAHYSFQAETAGAEIKARTTTREVVNEPLN